MLRGFSSSSCSGIAVPALLRFISRLFVKGLPAFRNFLSTALQSSLRLVFGTCRTPKMQSRTHTSQWKNRGPHSHWIRNLQTARKRGPGYARHLRQGRPYSRRTKAWWIAFRSTRQGFRWTDRRHLGLGRRRLGSFIWGILRFVLRLLCWMLSGLRWAWPGLARMCHWGLAGPS